MFFWVVDHIVALEWHAAQHRIYSFLRRKVYNTKSFGIVSACLTIGAYSTWLNTATELSILAPIIETLTRGMSTSEDSAAAAALAFRHVCAGMVSPGPYFNCIVCF